MAGVNKVILIGNLGQDPELRDAAGQPTCNLSVATSRKWQDKDGGAKEATEWHRVVVWGKQAENCAEYLAKGRQVYVEGRLQTHKWKDKDGHDRWTTEVVAQTVQFLGGKEGTAAPARPGSSAARHPDPEAQWEDDDPIPF